MAERRLTSEEAALWRRVMATVRPARTVPANPPMSGPAEAVILEQGTQQSPARIAPLVRARAVTVLPPPPRAKPGTTLDGSWDKKLATGIISPDSAIDLHGHSLQSAHAVLDSGLDRAIANGERVLLLITGKPPRPESERPHARGRIRDAVGDWLTASRHAANIAAVRAAHPRHGGAGALYIVLRRPRGDRKF